MYKRRVIKKLSSAGISINEPDADPKASIEVHDDKFYVRCALNGSLGFGETYADGLWDCRHLDEIVYRILNSGISTRGISDMIVALRSVLFNMQNKVRARRVAKDHYDVDTDVFEWMLDPYMQYTCGYWNQADSLNASQTEKMDLIIRKLGLKAGDEVLDIGCGWGGFAKYAAQNYGIRMFGLSISQSQLKYASRLCEGLDCTFRFGDYRDLAQIYPQKFDAITIIGVTEHIGYKNLKGLHKIMRDRLNPNGLVLLHAITHMESCRYVEPFIDRYIFPGGMVPSVEQLSTAMKHCFVLEDVHNFGADYDLTLMAWHQNFARAKQQIIAEKQLGERFYRVWEYYLLTCAGMFRARKAQLMQMVLSPRGVSGGYSSIR